MPPLALVAAGLAVAVSYGFQAAGPAVRSAAIDLSPAALPRYAALSVARALIAYALSLAFTLVYGTVAAHHRPAERLMMPALDVLQAVPVLSFLPALTLAAATALPGRQLGLELACVAMVFTAQAWNMTFSFHAGVRAVPPPLRDAAAVYRWGWWRTFCRLELPAAAVGLVWNSMMSMAGGWFFLTVAEAFTLAGTDYRLPGLGSYMTVAVDRGDGTAVAAAAVTMAAVIVLMDQLFWRPLTVFVHRFRMEEGGGGPAAGGPRPEGEAGSWVLELLRRSCCLGWLGRAVGSGHRMLSRSIRTMAGPRLCLAGPRRRATTRRPPPRAARHGRLAVLALAGVVLAGVTGVAALGRSALPPGEVLSRGRSAAAGVDWRHLAEALLASFARTTGAVALAAAWAVPAGVLLGRDGGWCRRLQPLLQLAASFPAPMLFPAAVALLAPAGVPFGAAGLGLMVLAAQWYVLFNVVAGASALPADLEEAARASRLGTWGRWAKLYLPGVFPQLVTGLVTAAGGAWNATIVAEQATVGGRAYASVGLGATIARATAAADYPLLYAATLAMAGFVVLLNRLVWKPLYNLAEARYRLGD